MTEKEFRQATGYNGPMHNMFVYSQITGDNLVGEDNLAFSVDNPYYQQMQYARTKKDLLALRNSAVEWEANRQSLEEQRAYDDPSAQVARQRAAGLNPDLATGSGGSSVSSGSSATQAQANQDLEGMSDPMDTANTILNGIGVATSAISAVSSFMDVGLNFVKGVKTFGDFMSMSASAASIAASSADIAKATKEPQIQSIKDDADFKHSTNNQRIEATNASLHQQAQSAEFKLREDEASAYQKEQDYVSNLIDKFVDDPNVTKEDIFISLVRSGVDATTAADYANLAYQGIQTNRKKADYSEQSLAAKEAEATDEVLTYDFFKTMQEFGQQVAMANSQIALYRATFDETFAEVFFTSQNAELSAQNATDSLQLQSLQNQEGIERTKFNIDKLKRDVDVYFKQLNHLVVLDKQIEGKLKTLYSLPRTRSVISQIDALNVQRMHLQTRGSEELGHIYQMAGQALHSFYTGRLALSDSGDAMPGWTVGNMPEINMHDVTWSAYVKDPEAGKKSILDPLLSIVSKIPIP